MSNVPSYDCVFAADLSNAIKILYKANYIICMYFIYSYCKQLNTSA